MNVPYINLCSVLSNTQKYRNTQKKKIQKNQEYKNTKNTNEYKNTKNTNEYTNNL